MAKKRNSTKAKPLKRSTTMVNTIKEGQKFLDDTKRKRSTRTKTMAQTIKEGQQLIARNTNKNKKRDDSRSQSIQPKDQKKKQKKITKKKNLAGNKKKTSSKNASSSKNSKVQKKDQRKAKRVRPTRPSIPAQPASRPEEYKKTIFKTKSKDHLPIPAFGFIDVCFCIDATGSMSGQLAQAQSTILEIINNIQNKVRTEGLTLRFAVVSYRDHPPQDSSYVTQALDFTDGFQASQYVKKLSAAGGGDFPEAVHDGLMHCCKLNWVQLPGTPTLRYIFHIADAPPHGKQFGNTYQTNQGCLCGMKTSDLYHEINIRQIHYRLLKARTGTQLTRMAKQFKQNIVDFNQVQLSHAKQMDIKVSDMIIHEVIPGNI